MTANKTLLKEAKNLDILTDNQAQIDGINSATPWNQVFSMRLNEASNNVEQNYYNKDKGCSVKAQEDNIFDYKDFLK